MTNAAARPPRLWVSRRVVFFIAILTLCSAAAVGYALRAAAGSQAMAPTLVSTAPLVQLPKPMVPALASSEQLAPPGAAAPAAGTSVRAAQTAATTVPGDHLVASSGSHLLFRNAAIGPQQGRVGLVNLDALSDPPQMSELRCERVHFAVNRGICLTAKRGMLTTYHAHVFDRDLNVLHSLALAGAPSRARIAPDGRLAAMTVFVSGHSYSSLGFSTRTSILDTATGQWVVEDLESFAVTRDGENVRATDFNFWGVSFANDGQRFYATLATAGTPYLVEGDLRTRSLRVVLADVECPSLSPDNRTIAFKRRARDSGARHSGWQVGVLDLASSTVRLLAEEARSVDDQVEWLDNREIAYALPDDGPQPIASTNVWALRADGKGAPRRLLSSANSPAALR